MYPNQESLCDDIDREKNAKNVDRIKYLWNEIHNIHENLIEFDQSNDYQADGFQVLQSCTLNLQNITEKIEKDEIIIMDVPVEHPFDIWNDMNVKMPHSPRNMFRNTNINNWRIIQDQLGKKFKSGKSVEKAIKSYNDNLSNFNFDVLRLFVDTYSDVLDVLNRISILALELPDLFTKPIPLLRKETNKAIILSQKQVACLIANAFFCTFPRRSKKNKEYEYFPIYNFSRLKLFYTMSNNSKSCLIFSLFSSMENFQVKFEKLKCIFTYFKAILSTPNSTRRISFKRKFMAPHQLPNWNHLQKSLSKLMITNSGRMDINGKNYSVVDFANSYIGGGVIGRGCVQEEILFMICPELLVSRLIMESLNDYEAVEITGHLIFNYNLGFNSENFEWKFGYEDKSELDELGRSHRQIIAIDAINFKDFDRREQFNEEYILRELNKAYIGFYSPHQFVDKQPAIVTGKWGCGAYKGDPELKYLIQLLAASEAGRDLIFYAFNDEVFAEKAIEFNEFIQSKDVSIKVLYKLINDFKSSGYSSVFDFVQNNLP